MFQDLSGPTNGLIILSSVSLAITQFFYQDLKGRFADGRAALEIIFDDIPRAMKEPMRQQLDNILNSTVIGSLRLQMGFLFCVLVACGIMKTVEMGDVWWNSFNSIHSIEELSLAILTFICTIIMMWIGKSINTMGGGIKRMEVQIEGFKKEVKVIKDTIDRLHPPTQPPPPAFTPVSER